MIPYGLNPFGLEDKILTYHFFQNGIEYDTVPVKTHKNRLYCWAEIPQKYREDYGLEWSTQYASTEAEWDALQKYYTKKMEELEPIVTSSGIVYPEPYWAETGYLDSSGRQREMWMVHGNQDLYRCTFINWTVPEYASVYVIDTSGSMGSGDYDSVKCSITEAISEYNCFEHSQTDSKMWMYNGTYASNIASQRLGSLSFEDLLPKVIYNTVNDKVNRITKRSSSEAMITCLYCAIADIQKQVVSENSITSGHLKALNFVLCTDESIFTGDTLRDYDEVKTKFPWFKKWQTNATYKFPSTISGISKVNFAKAITNALKQMSYYYGVNMSWALTRDITQDWGSIGSTIPFINVPATTGIEETKMTSGKYVPSTVWNIPSGFHINYPHEMMCVVELVIPDGMSYLSSLMLSESDQYNYISLMGDASHMNKFHSVNSRKACAFRFWGETVKLPTMEYIDGGSGVYKWVRDKDGIEFDPGAVYTTNGDHCSDYLYPKVIFTLTVTSTALEVILHLNNRSWGYPSLTTANWTTSVGTLTNPSDLQSNRIVYMTPGEAIPEIPGCSATGWTFKNWMASGVPEGYPGRTSDGYYHFPDGEGQLSSHIYDFGAVVELWAQWTEDAPAATTYAITFDPRINSTYWQSLIDAGRTSWCSFVPILYRTYGEQLYTLPTMGLNSDQVNWPNAYMDSERGSLGEQWTVSTHVSELKGWYTSKVGGSLVSTSTTVAGNATYYAKWKWTLTWNVNNADMQSEEGQLHCNFGIIPGEAQYRLTVENLRVHWNNIDANAGYTFMIMPAFVDPTVLGGWTPYGYTSNWDGTSVSFESISYTSGYAGANASIGTYSYSSYPNTPVVFVHAPKGTGDLYLNFSCVINIPKNLRKYNIYFWTKQTSSKSAGGHSMYLKSDGKMVLEML